MEPELTPTRMGALCRRAAATTRASLSGPPRLPGLMRMHWAPCSTAATARRESKWMSAMSGMAMRSRMALIARAAAISGTATRMISQPACSSWWIWWTVASTSLVRVLVMDWTAIGAPPPTATPPT